MTTFHEALHLTHHTMGWVTTEKYALYIKLVRMLDWFIVNDKSIKRQSHKSPNILPTVLAMRGIQNIRVDSGKRHSAGGGKEIAQYSRIY
jgi:hypothetical protein